VAVDGVADGLAANIKTRGAAKLRVIASSNAPPERKRRRTVKKQYDGPIYFRGHCPHLVVGSPGIRGLKNTSTS
jgi:hypothetical protein